MSQLSHKISKNFLIQSRNLMVKQNKKDNSILILLSEYKIEKKMAEKEKH